MTPPSTPSTRTLARRHCGLRVEVELAENPRIDRWRQMSPDNGRAPSSSPAAQPASAPQRSVRSDRSNAFSPKRGARCRTPPADPGDPQNSRAALHSKSMRDLSCADSRTVGERRLPARDLRLAKGRRATTREPRLAFVLWHGYHERRAVACSEPGWMAIDAARFASKRQRSQSSSEASTRFVTTSA